jgi:hypothetical protein
VGEAAATCESNLADEKQDPYIAGQEAEELLDQYFAPLVAEAETMIRMLAAELGQRPRKSERGRGRDHRRPLPAVRGDRAAFRAMAGWAQERVQNVVNKGLDLAKDTASAFRLHEGDSTVRLSLHPGHRNG